ncbi:hypothetical protein EW146_g9842, partial [Bondarzewia mesenterica]
HQEQFPIWGRSLRSIRPFCLSAVKLDFPSSSSHSFFSKNVHRHPTFVNFCITIIIYSIVFSLLIYSGQYRLAEPNKSLCIAQASMIMGILPMVCVAGLAAVIQLWATFQDPGSIIFSLSSKTYSTIVLLVMPYLAFLGYTIAGVIVGSRYPKLVKPSNGIYCFHKINVIRLYAEPIPCMVVMATTAGFERTFARETSSVQDTNTLIFFTSRDPDPMVSTMDQRQTNFPSGN